MTLNSLKGRYARLSNEFDALAGSGERNQSRLVRLLNEMDQVHHELVELRRRTLAAPTLRDVVSSATQQAPYGPPTLAAAE